VRQSSECEPGCTSKVCKASRIRLSTHISHAPTAQQSSKNRRRSNIVTPDPLRPLPDLAGVIHTLASAEADSRQPSVLLKATAVEKTIWASGDFPRGFNVAESKTAASPAESHGALHKSY